MNDTSDDVCTVLMCPDFSEWNPYQTQLIDALEGRNVDVTPISAVGVLPLLSGCLRHGLPDVVHLHWLDNFFTTDRRFKSILMTLLGIRLILEVVVLTALGVRTVWTIHNLSDHERHVPRIECVIRHVVARLMDRMIVHCERAAETVRTTYRLPERTADRIRVVPHGNYDGMYTDEVNRSDARRTLDLTTDSTVLLYFGQIRPYKNVPELIETFRTIEDERARLLIVGNPCDESMAADVRRISENDDRVRTVLEFVPDYDVHIYLNAADAVVLPFERILTSGSAVLAMTFGRGVIAPAIGCLPELVGDDGGILYDATTRNALHSALSRAVAEPRELDNMGHRNRLKADQLEWDRIAAKTRDVFRCESDSTPPTPGKTGAETD